ncbi:MAG: hypothetical protein IPM57_10600 [Oligoflexia bacterium]|nr:hypothetical protein [Oligoflexia bacterium]
MGLKQELLKRKEKTWVIITPKPKKLKFSPLVGLIDFYNHQQITRSYKNKKIALSNDERTIIACDNFFNVQKLVLLPVNKESQDDPKGFLKNLDLMIDGLKEKNPLIIVSDETPEEVIEAIKKKSYQYLVG